MARPDYKVDPTRAFEERCVTAEQAAARVRSGDLVWIPSGHAPPAVLRALAKREPELRDVKLRTALIPDLGWFRAEARAHWDLQVQYAYLPHNREALAKRVIDFHPYSMIQQHKAIDAGREEAQPIDVLLLTVSPPDARGFMCVGASCWDSVTNLSRARTVIAEVNASVPRTRGDTWLHVSQLDACVRNDRPRVFAEIPTEFDPADRAIAAHVRTLIRDRDTIQVGLGSHTGVLPLLGAFDHAEDLAYFGELTVPGLVDLARRGNITGRYAALHPGKFVAAQIGNSPADLEFVEDNPAFELRSYEYTNDPRVIARHENMVALNGALMVDLTGQIGVYSIGPDVYTGLGGHLGFAFGAFLAPKGRAVTVLPSTARGGTVSTIVPQFERGQIVSVPRELADTIVTDQGIARLLGKSVRERAEELIRVAHPDFRAELTAAARRLYWP